MDMETIMRLYAGSRSLKMLENTNTSILQNWEKSQVSKKLKNYFENVFACFDNRN